MDLTEAEDIKKKWQEYTEVVQHIYSATGWILPLIGQALSH